PTTYDNVPEPVYWFVNENANITLTCVDDNECNRTYYCVFDIGAEECNDFNVSYSNITNVLVTCANNSACQKKIKYYSVDSAENIESLKYSNPIYIVHNSSVNGTEAQLCNITSSSYVLNGYCNNCYVENSTVINSSIVGLVGVYRYHCRIINSTVINVNLTNAEIYNTFVDPSVLIDSLIENSTIIDSTVRSSVVINSSFSNCGHFEVITSGIYNNILTAGLIIYNYTSYYAPRNLTDICLGVSPVPKGYLEATPIIVKNGSTILFKYHGANTGYEVILLKDSFDTEGGYISLLDNGVGPDEVADDGIYTGTAQVNSLETGYKTVIATINDRVGNVFNVSTTILLDNIPPNATLLINDGDSVTITRHVVLKINYSDNVNVSKCRFANEDLNFSDWYLCQQTIPWVLSFGNGTKTVYLEITDVAGNSYITNDTIILQEGVYDLTPPENLTVYDAGDWSNDNTSIYCSWNAFDRESKVFYYYRIVGVTEWTYAGEQKSALITNLSLSEGTTYYCEVYAQNSYFINSSTQTSDGITIDITPPILYEINSSVANNTWTNQNSITFNWSAYDPISNGVSSGINAYSFVLDDNEFGEPDNIPEGDLNNLSNKTSHTYNYIRDGVYYFHVKAQDKAGNWGNTLSYVLLIDTIPPTAPYMQNPTQTASSSIITFSWNASTDPSPYANSSGVYRYLINITYDNGTEVLTDWVYQTEYNFTSAENGITYHASVRAQDYAGNLGESSDSAITFDSQPPNIIFKKPSSSGIVISSSPILVLETDENAICYYNNTLFLFTNSTHHETKVYVTNGNQEFDIKCYDAVGNLRTDIISFYVDTTADVNSLELQTQESYFISNPVQFNVIVKSSGNGIGEIQKTDFEIMLNQTKISDFTMRDLGGGNYSLAFIAPNIPSNYELKVILNGIEATDEIIVENTGLNIEISSSFVETRGTTRIISGILDNASVGLASDSLNLEKTIESSLLKLKSDMSGNAYIFITKQNFNPKSREDYLRKKLFLELTNPSFGYAIQKKNYLVNTELNYPGIIIISNDTIREGFNNIIIRNAGYDANGNLIIVISTI
ncbi:MAG: fibronectin type III domain-containing protein, partial [Candidatus Woesearchaeota archaeon]